MSGSNATADRAGRRRWRRLLGAVSELVWLLTLLTLWTVGLTLLFLATGWPRWAFYASVLIGVVVFADLRPRAD